MGPIFGEGLLLSLKLEKARIAAKELKRPVMLEPGDVPLRVATKEEAEALLRAVSPARIVRYPIWRTGS